MTDQSMQAFLRSSVLDGGNSAYLEELYEQYLSHPESLSPEWLAYFKALPQVTAAPEVSHAAIVRGLLESVKQGRIVVSAGGNADHEKKQIRVQQLIQAYRMEGHQISNIEPLGLNAKPKVQELSLEYHGLSAKDYDTIFDVGDFLVGTTQLSLREIEAALKKSYCGSIATEFLHIVSKQERDWIQTQIEGARCDTAVSVETQKRLLSLVTDAEGLEKYLGAKYPGAKRFSLEGGDAFIIMMDDMIRRSGENGLKEVVLGMAHRGRLNVLVNTFGKRPADLFAEFEGKHHEDDVYSGDVKYHQGFSSDIQTKGGPIHISMAFNPSHLEIVTPVVIGSVKSRQRRLNDANKELVLPLTIHGDSAFAGQGVVMEILNMSQTRGYGVGGTVHIVINNQVGFTTSNPEDTRSTLYCSDVAKVIQAPIFHVNGDDPEAVLRASRLALDYKLKFKKDVVIDLVCYRRHGHNEADEPSATQPMMYQIIRKHPTVRQLYADRLVKSGVLSQEVADDLVLQNRSRLDKGESVVVDLLPPQKLERAIDWSVYLEHDWRMKVDTTLSVPAIRAFSEQLTTLPEGLQLHPRVSKIIEDRKLMAQGELPCDWGFAETMAYAGLLSEGFDVRLSGQDCGRGTFFHRHAVLHCQKTGTPHIALKEINPAVDFTVIDSVLSEEAVLAFEYGYASSLPSSLVIWEAQFGDFANGAQVVIDQFISSGEQKWKRLCGLVLLLPHGYEGQGPEHSSARLERFLQLCAEYNMQVCVPSTPAQVFHMLRRQMVRKIRRPLIVMSPKSLLRHKDAVSTLEELSSGQFYPILEDKTVTSDVDVTRVVLCSGKVYYDLHAARVAQKQSNLAIIRIEQLYPFPEPELHSILARYKNAKMVVWCQEEPQNQGAWYSSQHHMRACLQPDQTLSYAGRHASASPAAGYTQLHQRQQEAFVQQAITE